jgi:hypothetical protein
MHQHKLITLAAYSVWIITINPSIAYSRSINKIRNLIGANNTLHTAHFTNTQNTKYKHGDNFR